MQEDDYGEEELLDSGREAALYRNFDIPQDMIGLHPLSRSAYNNSDDQMFVRKLARYDSTKGNAHQIKPVQARFVPNVDLEPLPEDIGIKDAQYALASRRILEQQERSSSARRSSGGFQPGKRSSSSDYNSLEDVKYVNRLTKYNSLGPADFQKFLHDPKTSSAPMSPVRESRSPVHKNRTAQQDNSNLHDDYFSRIQQVSRRRPSNESYSAEHRNFVRNHDSLNSGNEFAALDDENNQQFGGRTQINRSYTPAEEAQFVNKSMLLFNF
jgi:hypothetical protein